MGSVPCPPMDSPDVLAAAAPLVRALVRRPDLWPAAFRLVPPRWWRRWPPVPWPAADYVRFRLETMYGAGGPGAARPGPAGDLDPGELIRYLEWCQRMAGRAR